MKTRFASLFATAATVLLLALPARAGLIGDTLTATGTSLNPSTATVGAGVEFTGIGSSLQFNFDATTLTVTDLYANHGWGGFGFYTFTDLSSVFTNVSIASNTGSWYGGIVNNFSFTDHTVTFDLNNGGHSGGALVFNLQSTANTVPDSGATVALLGGALLGLVALRRRLAI